MEINVKFDFVDGSFDTDTGKLECVKNTTHSTVKLCFKENMNIPFAKIKLYSSDLLRDANEVLDNAANLGNEITKRWNVHHELLSMLIRINKIAKDSNPDDVFWNDLYEADSLIDKIKNL